MDRPIVIIVSDEEEFSVAITAVLWTPAPDPPELARQEGLEPPTYGFGDRRSAN